MDAGLLIIILSGLFVITVVAGTFNAHLNDKLRARVERIEKQLNIK